MSDLHLQPVGNSLWRAGAGAGKTYNLVLRVLRIAEDWAREHDGRFPRLVVTTFTRMATQELRVRLMEAALREAQAKRSDRPDLVPFVTSRSHLFVTTLHGVMDSFLRSFGSEIGLEPGFRVGGAEEIESMVRRVGKKTLFPQNDAAQDDASHRQAVDKILSEFDFSTSLKLLQRVAKIRTEFEDTDSPSRPAEKRDLYASMALALKDLVSPVRDLHDEIRIATSDPKWEPFSNWLSSLVREMNAASADDLRLDELTTLIESEPKITNSGKHKIDFGAGKNWKDPLKAVGNELENLKAETFVAEKFERMNQAFARVERSFSETLRAEKFKNGLIELEDLELLALELVRKSPSSAERYAESWDHWLIDEYQDTSPRQVLLISALAKGRPQFVVGDPQQSIYLFRGARPNVFLDREEMAKVSKHETVELLGNRRSHANVMDFVNHAVSVLGDEFQPMTAERAKLDDEGRRPGSIASPFGAATFLALEPSMYVDDAGKEKAVKIDEQRRAEAEKVSSAVNALLAAGASPASIAILARSNKDLAIVAREFGRTGLPFQVHTAGAYSDRLEVADLCALLGFLANPHDDENLIHLARTIWFPIDENQLARGYRRTLSLWTVLEELQKENESHESFLEIEALQSGLLAARERGVVQAFREMLSGCEFFSWCGILDPSGRREANALKFLSKLATAERQAGFVPGRFIDEVLGGGDRGSENESGDRDAVAAVKPDRIHLMTIHVSKGLEFDHVFLPFLSDTTSKGRSSSEFVLHEQKRLWSVGLSVDEEAGFSAGPLAREWNSILRAWGTEEQKRLLYVALTRARESLFLSATGEPKKESFLQFLSLSRDAGPHGAYQTRLSLDGIELTPGGGSHRLQIPQPWRRPEGVLTKGAYAGISVTRLLEVEDEATLKMEGRTAKSPRAQGATSAKRALHMAKAAARGTRLHRVFELAKPEVRGKGIESTEAMAREITRWFVDEEQESAREALAWLLALQTPDLSAILVNGETEWSFTYLRQNLHGDDWAIDGQIDLWGRDGDGKLWVVDYKTGDSFFKDKALRQLRYYSEALVAGGHAKPGEEISLCALYPFSNEVFTELWVPHWE